MASVNKVILVGRAGRDPQTKVFDSGSVTNIALATSEKYKDKQTGETKEITTWHDLVFWNRLAEIAAQYIKKGSLIYVEGSIKSEKYQKDGQDVYRTKIIVNSLQLLGDSNGGHASQTPSKPAATPASTGYSGGSSFDPSDDIPF